MSDFTNDFWSLYVGGIALISILGCAVLLYACSTRSSASEGQDATTGHKWDEDLEEWNNPLPRWWMWLFYATIVFGLVYLVLYPGLGTFGGTLHWSSRGQYDDEQKQAAAQYGPLFEKYLKQDVIAVAADPQARAMGQRLFLTYCSQCHGSDAGGGKGFPNLRDNDWLYGGDPETIKATITNGRVGLMPAIGATLGGPEKVRDVANYVLSLSGHAHDAARAARGQPIFNGICAACHLPTGKGNPALGSANLTDTVWLHGGAEAQIIETINKGRNDVMPAHKDLLDEGKIHLLTAYVYGLSHAAPGK